MQRWFFEQLKGKTITIDLDSSVVTRYGQQEGSRKGFNPKKPGRPSHHPLLAFIPELRMVANAWLRPENSASASGMQNFLEEAFHIVQEKKVGLVRADSGFYGDNYLKYMELKRLPYIVSVKLHKPLKMELVSQKNWVEVADGIQVSEFTYCAHGWKNSRRMMQFVRK